MYAIDFETNITGKYLELKGWQSLVNKHARVIILVDEEPVTSETSADLDEFRALQAARSDKPKVARDVVVERIWSVCQSEQC